MVFVAEFAFYVKHRFSYTNFGGGVTFTSRLQPIDLPIDRSRYTPRDSLKFLTHKNVSIAIDSWIKKAGIAGGNGL